MRTARYAKGLYTYKVVVFAHLAVLLYRRRGRRFYYGILVSKLIFVFIKRAQRIHLKLKPPAKSYIAKVHQFSFNLDYLDVHEMQH